MNASTAMVPVTVPADIAAEGPANERALAALTAREITSAADLADCEELLVLAKTRWKELEEMRTGATKPLNAGLRQINAWFKPVQGPLEQAERVLKAKIGAYVAAQMAAQAPAMVAVASGVPGAALVVPPSHSHVSVKCVWKFRVTDAALVPRELCSPDETKIAKSIWYANTPHTPPKDVPGLEFYLDGQVRRTGA
jgi:hypothetical protein